MAQLIPIFLLGVIGVSVLLVLKHFNIRWAMYLIAGGSFLLMSYESVAQDWRITIANTLAMAVLFFVPLAAVFVAPKHISKVWVSNVVVLLVGGATALTFQFAAFSVAYLLGAI